MSGIRRALTLVVLAVAILAGIVIAAAIFLRATAQTEFLAQDLGNTVVVIELKTGWSYSRATDAFVAVTSVGLLIAWRVLSEIAAFALRVAAMIVAALTGAQWAVDMAFRDRPAKIRWLWAPLVIWTLSLAVTRVFP